MEIRLNLRWPGGSTYNGVVRNVAFWLRLLKKSAVRWCENSPELILHGRNDTRDHINGSTRHQDEVLGVSTSPFVSLIRNTAQWARKIVPCAFRRLLQQPQPGADDFTKRTRLQLLPRTCLAGFQDLTKGSAQNIRRLFSLFFGHGIEIDVQA